MSLSDLLRYDLHTHTKYSDGYMDVRMMVRSAEAAELSLLGITDHLFEEGEVLGSGPGTVDDLLRDVAAIRPCTEVTVLAGVEGTILDTEGRVSVEAEVARKLDLVIVDFGGRTEGVFRNAPSGRSALVENAVRALVNACANPVVDLVGHPLNLGRCTPPIDLAEIPESALEEVADAFVHHRVAFEVMSQMPFWFPEMPVSRVTEEYTRIVRLCRDRGVRFSVSSDAHRGGSVGNLIWSERVLRDAEVPPEQIVDPLDLVRGRRVRG